MKRLAILGAGVAGLAAAWALRDAPVDITLFEKSRGVGGRAATRGREGVRYDHGANYFTLHPERVRRVIAEGLPVEDLVQISRPVLPYPVETSPPVEEHIPARWNYRHGISQLAKLLATASSAELVLQTRIERLTREPGGWALIAEGEHLHGPFDAVLLTAPAPQSATLLEASDMEPGLRYHMTRALRRARYESQLCFVLGYKTSSLSDEPWYARVDVSRQHPVVWAAFENAKPGHVPEGQQILLAQMAPAWSTRHYLESFEELLPDVLEALRAMLPALPDPDWFDGQRWRFARAIAPADTEGVLAGIPHGLFVAGDGLATRSRVEQAIETGLDAAQRISQRL